MRLTVLVGPPGSGKSTLAKQLEVTGTTRISQDDQGKDGHWLAFRAALKAKKDIVVDRMNFNKEQRMRYIIPAEEAGYEIEAFVFHENYKTCLARCLGRHQHPTIKTEEDAVKALDLFFKNYERVDDSQVGTVNRCYPKGDKPKAIICDLDGTLYNVDHRLHWVRGEGKKNWPMFFAGIKDDTVNDWCRDILSLMEEKMDIVLCSGRGEEYRIPTIRRLYNDLIVYSALFMRPEGDYRRDDIVKEIILDFEILSRYEPYFFIDDRQQVVDMWRKRGYTCLQCAPGDF